MKITLKMQIQEQEISLVADLTLKACRIFRQQFSEDLLLQMKNIYKAWNKSPFEGIDLTGVTVEGKTEQEIYAQLLNKIDVSKLTEIRELTAEETEMGYKVIWAFAKNADPALPGFDEWADSFEYILPIGEIVSALYKAWNESAKPTIEIKN